MLTRSRSSTQAASPQSERPSSVPQATPQSGRISPAKSLLKLDDNEQVDVVELLRSLA
jgi:hypothetical protein